MAEITRYQRSEAAQAVPTSKAEANNLNSLADRLRQFSNRQFEREAQQAGIEGKQAGQLAASGKIGGLDLSDNSTIRSRAFNQGAQLSHAAAIKIDINENISRLKMENPYDVAAFTELANGYKKGLLAEVDPSIRAMAEGDLNTAISNGTIKIGADFMKQEQTKQVATIQKGVDVAMELSLQMAARGDIEGSDDQMNQIRTAIEAGIEANLPGVDQAYLDTTMSKLTEAADYELILGEFKRELDANGIEAAENALDAFSEYTDQLVDENGDEVSILPDTKRKIISAMETLISRDRSDESRAAAAIKAQRAAKTKEIKRQAKKATYALKKNQIPDGVNDLVRDAQLNGDNEVAEDLMLELIVTHEMIATTAEDGISFVDRSPIEQEEVINELQKQQDLSPGETRLLERMKETHDYTMAEIKKGNAMILAVEQGVISDLPQIDFSDPKRNSAEFYDERMKLHELVEAQYDMELSPFTNIEADSLISYMNSSEVPIAAKILAMTNLVDGLDDSANKVMEQLFDKNAVEYTMVGDLMINDNPVMAFKILEGMDLIKFGTVEQPTGLHTSITGVLGDLLSNNPKYLGAVIEATKAAYMTEPQTGTAVGQDVEAIVKNIVGGIIDVGSLPGGRESYTVIPPDPSINAGQFGRRLNDLQLDDIEAHAKSGGFKQAALGYSNEEVLDLIQNKKLVNVPPYGEGVYLVQLGESELDILRKPNGDPFEFKYNLRAGIPETY
jgi:hypothetical protein